MDLEVLIENTLNAVAAGLTIGCIYGLMCIGLGLIFGIMRIVNFAQGELLMLGMYASLYLVTGAGVFAFLGPYFGPFIGALCAGPIVFAGGALLHKFLIARVSGLRTAGSIDDGHFGQLLVTLGHLADPAERRIDRVRLHAADRAHAACLARLRDCPASMAMPRCSSTRRG